MSVIPAGSQHPEEEYVGSDPTYWRENDPANCPILQLNDDCLMDLFSFLTLAEQMSLSETCLRLSGILETKFYIKKSLIVKEDELTEKQLVQILFNVGHHLHQFQIKITRNCFYKSTNLIIQLIATFCPNLRELVIFHIPKAEVIAFREIGLCLNNLTKLILPFCHINDAICRKLITLKNIEYIDFSYNQKITGRYLNCFKKLVHLNLFCCSNIQPNFVSSICENGLLKWLNIALCSNLINDGISEVLFKLKHLEKLSIDTEFNEYQLNKIIQLDSVKSLTIHQAKYNLTQEFFKTLVVNKSEKLETLILMAMPVEKSDMDYIFKLENLRKLHINFYPILSNQFVEEVYNLKQLKSLGLAFCQSIHPQALIKLFENQTEIMELNIMGNYQITNEHFFKIAERLKARGANSRCIIYAYNTEISKEILKNKRYTQFAPFVSLSFEEPSFEFFNSLDD